MVMMPEFGAWPRPVLRVGRPYLHRRARSRVI
uniref:Uncharacterized protein n=1 Tax=Zea mays TaxID=4577 RepID=B6T4I3_MAIZE|nr:hypothetical protein [Zea mays]